MTTARTPPDLAVEHRLFAAGCPCVIGIDEVGRGALAGPVAVGAAVLEPVSGPMPAGLRDSKLLSARQRGRLAPLCAAWATFHAVGMTSACDIDRIGIVRALGLAACRALEALLAAGFAPGEATILLDGGHDWLSPALASDAAGPAGPAFAGRCRVVTRVKADRDCGCVAAASVLAKVRRDALMSDLARRAPAYGWSQNKGYGTRAHRSALAERGATPWHRHTWLHPAAAPAADSA